MRRWRGRVPSGDVILASTPSKRHARGVSALLHGGLTADAAVYLHPAESGVGMREIKAFCLGPARVPPHSPRTCAGNQRDKPLAFVHRGQNPVRLALGDHQRLTRSPCGVPARIHHPLLERASAARPISSSPMSASEGAASYTRVAPEGIMEGSLSLLPGEDLQQVQAAVEEVVRGEAQVDWLNARDDSGPGAEVALDDPLYRWSPTPITAVSGPRRTSIRCTPRATSAIRSCRRASRRSGWARLAATSRRTG